MCELLGVSCNKPVRANISFKALKADANDNPHGWGLAYYPDQSAQIFKEPLKALESELANFVAKYEMIKSKNFMCHIRYMTTGSPSHRNTHPFSRELNGREYVFAHNGSVLAVGDFKFNRFRPVGDTDSEKVFCHLMDFIAQHKLNLDNEADLSLLEDRLREINGSPGAKLNCLISDGKRLLCYRDRGGHKKLLILLREPGYMHTVRYYGDEEIDFEFKIKKGTDERAVIVSTEALTRERWRFLPRACLTVLEDGRVLYPTPLEEEQDTEKVEVYKSPRYSSHLAGFPDVVGMPESLRDTIGVSLGEMVRVINGDQALALRVCKTSKYLVGSDPDYKADQPQKHIWLPPKARKKLGLDEEAYRNGCKKFKTKYSPVSIERVN